MLTAQFAHASSDSLVAHSANSVGQQRFGDAGKLLPDAEGTDLPNRIMCFGVPVAVYVGIADLKQPIREFAAVGDVDKIQTAPTMSGRDSPTP